MHYLMSLLINKFYMVPILLIYKDSTIFFSDFRVQNFQIYRQMAAKENLL